MKFRPVTMKDADFLLILKNDPITRQNAIITHEEIKKENHLVWLEKKLKDHIQFYIILKHGKPIGDLRIESDGEISVRIIPNERGKGYGFMAISMVKDKVYARIAEGNIASMNIFTKNGFKFTDYKEGVYILKR